MLTGIFERQIESIDSEIAQLQALIEAKNQRQNQLIDLQAVAESALDSLSTAVSQIEASEPTAIASLKSAVLAMFGDGNGGDEGWEPTAPTPTTDPDQTAASELPKDDPIGSEHILPSDKPLTGQTCDIDTSLHWENASPDGSAWELACPVSFEAQSSSITPENQYTYTNKTEDIAYCELVNVSDRIAYQRKHDGQIICSYLGFRTKGVAVSWQKFIEPMTSSWELRAGKHLQGFKWELKCKGLSITQIQRLSEEDFTKAYKPEALQPLGHNVTKLPNEFEAGDVVVQSLTPSASFKIIQIMPNGVLDCENLTTGDRLGLRPSAVQLIEKANVSPKQTAKILLKDCQWYGQSFPIVQGNKVGYTLATPDGNHWFRTDCVEVENSSPYQVTTGNYTGTSRQTRNHWEKLGIDPKELIAQMRDKRPPEPEWNAAKYNPILAAVGADDASDF